MRFNVLVESVKSLDWEARIEACARLGALRDARAVPVLRACLDDEDVEVRIAAISALGATGLLEALPGLLERLLDENTHVRAAVWAALGGLGPGAVPPLLERVDSDSPEMRQSAVHALGALRDARALPALIERLEDENILVRQAACQALAALGDRRAVAPIIAQLAHPRSPVRIAACTALGMLGDPAAIDPLLPLLGDEDAHLRQAANTALERLGEGGLSRTVTQALRGNPEALATVAEMAIGGARWLIPPLTARLSDENLRVRQAAAAALGRIGEPCLEAVVARLAEHDADVRRTVFQVLRAAAGSSAINLLMDKYSDPRWRNRQVLLGALAAVGPAGAEALMAHLEHPDAAARLAAVQVLGTLKDPRAVPRLLGRLSDVHEAVRVAACEALGLLGAAEAIPVLLGCLRDITVEVRYAAAHALRAMGAVQAVDVLVPMLFDPEPAPSLLACETLTAMNEVLAPTMYALLCGGCLTRFEWHTARAQGVGEVPYLACRACHKAGKALRPVNLVVAVLDHALREPFHLDGTTARVHALGREVLFDFDGVEIFAASDYEVERFCMRIGNDTDPLREKRYRDMLCQVWRAEMLSGNTLNVLRSTFGRVIIEG
jgi:HEAT repeat protein